jgi:transposase
MRYELSDYEWIAIKPMLPNKPRGVPRVAKPIDVGVSERCGT